MLKTTFQNRTITVLTVLIFLCAQVLAVPQPAMARHPVRDGWKKASPTTEYDGTKATGGETSQECCCKCSKKCDKHNSHMDDAPLSDPTPSGEKTGPVSYTHLTLPTTPYV